MVLFSYYRFMTLYHCYGLIYGCEFLEVNVVYSWSLNFFYSCPCAIVMDSYRDMTIHFWEMCSCTNGED